jgi:hypothetical protein
VAALTAEGSLSVSYQLRCTDNAVIIMPSVPARKMYVGVNISGENKKK